MSNKDVKNVTSALLKSGFHLARTNRHQVYKKRGEPMFVVPTSIGQGRGLRNLIANLNRRGIRI